ncbi:aarF domain-containing kinase [Sporothrix brasiliensis 5110]|uniref:AarF domain-containing kinase n=1 Tax=Sporothrix brasiliensis 5110 TaxID=1398154 RepID=A0A0C2F722_9PEZI|nr:aarF domain-containing kinase [Sporothrix brasiliensis 5110]KIH86843.1 aarF domain-containing kinase [Sporothrix brasiliensis 5110]
MRTLFLRPSAVSSIVGSLGRQRASTQPSSQGWACVKCRRGQLNGQRTTAGVRFSSTASTAANPASSARAGGRTVPPPPPRSSRGRRAILLTASGGAATATILAFTDDIKQSYETVERTGRVAATLVLCINDYRKTLRQKDKIEDEAEQSALIKACHKRCALRTLHVLEKNGGIFIKLGQHLSAMNYLLPSEWTTTFIPLQDKCPVSSFESVQQMYRDDTGTDLWDYFSEFSAEPIGAASLAQVHVATIRETGQKVAVKVQHPSLAQWAPLDMALTTFTFSTLKRFFPEYDLDWLSSEMALSLPQELDFALEGKNAERTKAHFAAIPQLPLVVPDVLWGQERILVMAHEVGHRLDDLDYLDQNGIDRDEVSAALAHIFNEMIFGDGAPLHCDPHGGNLAVRARPPAGNVVARWLRRLPWRNHDNFDIILYDHGLYRDIPLALRRSYAKMWLTVLDGDMARMQRYAYEVAGVDEASFPLFASAITGRDYRVLASGSIIQPRTTDEKEHISGQLQDGLLAELVQLLGKVPRIILLILKTNDLTRSLDDALQTKQGPIRSFLIMAQYCLRTVFYEQVGTIREQHGSLWWPTNLARLLGACLQYLKGEAKLEGIDLWLRARRLAGMKNLTVGPPSVT